MPLPAPGAVTAMPDCRRRWLEAIGIDVWLARGPAVTPADGGGAPAAPDSVASGGGDADPAALGWDALEARVAGCTLCELHKGRSRTVFGAGKRDAEWMVIGEAPGAEEDRQGEPFVGRAGRLLNEMLLALGLRREDVYIANIVKCRPPGNRDPRPEEAIRCEPYLRRQVALVRPRIILAVGRIAAQNLLKSERNVGELRGRVHHYADTGIPLVVTYHPAYLLRSPLEKRKAWQDLCLAMRACNGGESAG
jgi:uracil-DNA glycosylase